MRKYNDQITLAPVGSPAEGQRSALTKPTRIELRHSEQVTRLTTTLIVESNMLIREGIARILAETPYNVLASCTQFGDLHEDLFPQEEDALLILGTSNGQMDFTSSVKTVKTHRPSAKIVLLVEAYDLAQVQAAYRAGVDAYLLKTISCQALVKSLDLVLLGEKVFPAAVLALASEAGQQVQHVQLSIVPSRDGQQQGTDQDRPVVTTVMDQLQLERLSSRETVILRCLMDGESNKLIARKFDIAEATVKVHVKAILRKIRAKNRTQAAIWAVNHLRQPQPTHA